MGRSRRRRSKRLADRLEAGFILDAVTLLLAGALLVRFAPASIMLSLEWFSGNQVVRMGLGVVALAIAVVNLRGRRGRSALLALGITLLVLVESFWMLPLKPAPALPAGAPSLRVLTFNVGSRSPAGIVEHIQRDSVDVACLQELFVRDSQALLARAREAGYEGRFVTLRDDAGMGTAILSRHPILSHDTLHTASWGRKARRFQKLRLEAAGREIHLVTVQLESTVRNRDLWGVIESWRLRLEQARWLAQRVHTTSGALVLAGDLNATPTNRAIHPLLAGLEDSWRMAGAGLGGSWPAEMPLLRLDYILARGFPAAASATLSSLAGSDHLAYRVDLRLPR